MQITRPFRFEDGLNFDFKEPPSPQKEKDESKVILKRKIKEGALEQELDYGVQIAEGRIVLTLPILTLSEANGLLSKTRFYKNGKPKPEHWTEKHERHKLQKNAVYISLNPIRHLIQLPCVVKFTRFAPHELDEDDNLRIAFKWIKDYCAEIIVQDFVPGRADSNKQIKWQYDQIKHKRYAVKIEISW